MANLKETKNQALATVDSALTILNKFPHIDDTNTYLSYDNSSNPFPFLMDLFKSCAGYNVLINILSKFILVALPPMEATIKAVLLANIKNLLSCSINPIISDQLLRDGIIFSLDQIDITDILKESPTSQRGRYFYFDNMNTNYNYFGGSDVTGTKTQFKFPDELKYSKDFNCLLWYMKHKAMFREVWGQKKGADVKTSIGAEDSDYWNKDKNKCRKGAGILTLEFNARSQSLRNAEGNGLGVQTPYNNIIHVFLGNTQSNDITSITAKETEFFENSHKLSDKNNEIGAKEDEIKECETEIATQEEYLKKSTITEEDFKKETDTIQQKIKQLKDEKDTLKNELDVLTNEKVDLTKQLQQLQKEQNLPNKYRSIKQNYYYRRTLIEFNTDYVMSLQFFDPKVVTAQLIDALIGLLKVDLHLSFKQEMIKNEIKKMIQMVVETDDAVVDDCFFTFTNDDYNAMMEKAEMNRANLFSVNGEENGTTAINAEALLESLNNIDEDAIANGDVTVIEHALTEIARQLSETDDSTKSELNFGVKMNFIENLMNNLAYVITYAVISPKLYLLILINLKILGEQTNFNLEQFIGSYKQLIVTLIRAIRDQLLKFITDELYKIIGNITTELAIKIGVEQMAYYARLMKKIFDCIKFGKGSGEGWNMDNPYYADIETDETIKEEKPDPSC